MIDTSMFNLLTAREFLDDQVMEAYLASKPGLIGAVGFRKIAEGYADTAKEGRAAKDESTRLLDAIKDKWRKDRNLGENGSIPAGEIEKEIMKWSDWSGPVGAIGMDRMTGRTPGATTEDSPHSVKLWSAASEAYIDASPVGTILDNDEVLEFGEAKFSG